MGVSIPRHFCPLRWCLEARPWLPIDNGVQPGIASAFLPKLLLVRMFYCGCRCGSRIYSFRRACGLGHAPATSIILGQLTQTARVPAGKTQVTERCHRGWTIKTDREIPQLPIKNKDVSRVFWSWNLKFLCICQGQASAAPVSVLPPRCAIVWEVLLTLLHVTHPGEIVVLLWKNRSHFLPLNIEAT